MAFAAQDEAAQRLLAQMQAETLVVPADFWIAVWAKVHATEVVTRNARDFAAMGMATRTWELPHRE